MNSSQILKELDDLMEKLKMKIMYYETEIKELRSTIEKLKRFVKEV
jgi:prefoldin subunit 5